MEQEKIKPLTLWINKKLWDEFKKTVPRDITLNDAVVLLIKKELNNETKTRSSEEVVDYYTKCGEIGR